jgi:alpha-glucoside transport system permease protein
MGDILVTAVTIVAGISATMAFFWLLNKLVGLLPHKVAAKVLPAVFIAPVLILLSVFLIYPAIQTVILSFMDSWSENFVGFDNYIDLFTSPEFLETLSNNALWIIVVPASSVILGLLISTFANNVGPLREKIFKSVIFMPMAISFVSAATIWSFTYYFQPEGSTQIGLLNAIVTALGADPQPWMNVADFKLNSLLLMVIVIWLNTGFSMVLLSAAIKGVPEETIEAARIDGASGSQTFFRIILPQIRGTVVAVFITVLIGVMKIFDIVLAMTQGNYGTLVLGMSFIKEYFSYNETGRASAIVVVLMVCIVPIMIYQVRSYRRQEELR